MAGEKGHRTAGLRAGWGARVDGRPAQIQATAGGQNVSGQLILIGNGGLYGGQYKLFPQADLHDGLLEVCVFPRVNWWVLARCNPGLLLNGTLPRAMTQLFQAETLTLGTQPFAGADRWRVGRPFAGHLPDRTQPASSGCAVIGRGRGRVLNDKLVCDV